jgi:hypothetical protein
MMDIQKIKQDVHSILSNSLRQQNNHVLRLQTRTAVSNYFAGLKCNRDINDFDVVCDSSNNPPSVVSNGNLVVDVITFPPLSLSYIKLSFVVSNNDDDMFNPPDWKEDDIQNNTIDIDIS